MTTGQAAQALGTSRQHVVNMCERGDLACVRRGSHRRIPRSEVEARIAPPLTREARKSLWLHRAVLGALASRPEAVLATARANLSAWKLVHRGDGMSAQYLAEWEGILDSGVDAVAQTLTSTAGRSVELRQNSPFAGVLAEEERREVLRAFRSHEERKDGSS